MRREVSKEVRVYKQQYVLILVLVEYAPRGFACRGRSIGDPQVLILVLVEYAPRAQKECGAGLRESVLILVLVEYAPRVSEHENELNNDLS